MRTFIEHRLPQGQYKGSGPALGGTMPPYERFWIGVCFVPSLANTQKERKKIEIIHISSAQSIH